MKPKQNKFMIHDTQNEIIQILANQITRYITANIPNNYVMNTQVYRAKNSYLFAYVGW